VGTLLKLNEERNNKVELSRLFVYQQKERYRERVLISRFGEVGGVGALGEVGLGIAEEEEGVLDSVTRLKREANRGELSRVEDLHEAIVTGIDTNEHTLMSKESIRNPSR